MLFGKRHATRLLGATLGGLLALSAAACGGSTGGGGGGGGGSNDTFVFGASADPKIIDGALVSDGESLRVIRQVFERLVDTKQGSTEIEPGLAEKWQASPDGTSWTFFLRQGVTFSDGTPFTSQAVCFNFDRWYTFKGPLQGDNASYYWKTVFEGYKQNEDKTLPPSLYSSCQPKDDRTAVIRLAKPSASFLSALSLPAFSIASPDALTKYQADAVTGGGDAPRFTGTFGTQHPVGTGPYKLESWNRGDKLTLVRNDAYWGPKAKIRRLIFRPIADGPARYQALQAGDIDGYDLVDPGDIGRLKDNGFQILQRPAFNVAYVGMNQKRKPLDNLKVRQAIAHALNRDALIKAKYPPGSQVAKEFMPPDVFGYADNVPVYDYDPAKARALLAEAGLRNPTIEFWYPTNVSRPYMPDPQANFQAFKGDLEKAGFRVVPRSAPWTPDYLDVVDTGRAGLFLLGWTGDFGDPDNFIGTFFQEPRASFGFNNPAIHRALAAAEVETNRAKRTQMYQDINVKIMQFLPGVPYAHTGPALAFKNNVKGFVPSPVQNEDFAAVTLT